METAGDWGKVGEWRIGIWNREPGIENRESTIVISGKMTMITDGLEKLEAWQKSREYANLIYRQVIPLLPADEKYNLVSQLRRAAVSIPANIAEGYGRYYYQSNIQFCYFARGAVEETISHIILVHDQGYITDPIFLMAREKGIRLIQLINGYIAYLKKAKQGENEPGSPKMIKEQLLSYGTADLSEDSFPTNHESLLSDHESRISDYS